MLHVPLVVPEDLPGGTRETDLGLLEIIKVLLVSVVNIDSIHTNDVEYEISPSTALVH